MVKQILYEMLATVLVPLSVLLALALEASAARSETGKPPRGGMRARIHLIVAGLALYSAVYVIGELGSPGPFHRGAVILLLGAGGYELYRYRKARSGGASGAA